MKFTLTALMFVFVSAAPFVYAEDVAGETSTSYQTSYKTPPKSRDSKPIPASWKWSLAPLVASQALDITSSYGMRELNPILAGPQGQFGLSSAMLKVSVTAAFIGVEYLVVKIHPGAARVFTKVNWAGSALTAGFAAHNFAIR
jgi:hypothetical protein